MGSRSFPARTVLFEKERNGVTYRVPSLLYIPRSATLLAFAEERLSADDSHANLLVLRQGTFYKTYVEWGDLKAIDTALLKKHRSMNPCPLYDEFTGTIFLFFIAVLGKVPESYQIITGQNLARLCYVCSFDQGNTWSTVNDLTEQVIGDSIKEWATFALGPGHGVQLKSGRLVVPAYTYHIDRKQCFGTLCKTTPHSFTFYSDDHGKNWQFGDFIPNLETVECQVASVDEEDGTNILYCNARSPLGFRVQALSTDNGEGFHSGQLVQKLVESQNGCHGSIIGFPAPFASKRSLDHYVWSTRDYNDLVVYGKPGMQNSVHHADQTKDIVCLSSTTLRSRHFGCCENLKEVKREVSFSPHDVRVLKDKICEDSVYTESEFGNNNEGNFNAVGTHHKDIASENFAQKGSLHDFSTFNVTCSFQSKPKPNRATKVNALFQNPTWVLYCHPTSPTSRVNLGVYLSTFPRDADSWTDPWVIYEGPSAYSDIAYIELSSSTPTAIDAPTIAFACIFENGIRSPYEQISFSIFTLFEVIQNIPKHVTYESFRSFPINCTNEMTKDTCGIATTPQVFPNIPLDSTDEGTKNTARKSNHSISVKSMAGIFKNKLVNCQNNIRHMLPGISSLEEASASNLICPWEEIHGISTNCTSQLPHTFPGNQYGLTDIKPMKMPHDCIQKPLTGFGTKVSKSITWPSTSPQRKPHLGSRNRRCSLS